MNYAIAAFKYECDICGVIKYKESKSSGFPDKWKRGASSESCFCDSCSRMLQEIGYDPTTHTFDKTLSIEKKNMDIGFIVAAGLILVLFVISPVDDMTMTLWTNTAHIVGQRWMVVSVNEIP